MLASYGSETRREAGGRLSQDVATPGGGAPAAIASSIFDCRPPSDREERIAIGESAREVARRFRAYRASMLPHYLLLYFDAIFSKVGGSGDATSILSTMLQWVEACGEPLFGSQTCPSK